MKSCSKKIFKQQLLRLAKSAGKDYHSKSFLHRTVSQQLTSLDAVVDKNHISLLLQVSGANVSA